MLLSGVQTIPEQLPLILTEGDAEEHESLTIIAGNEQLQVSLKPINHYDIIMLSCRWTCIAWIQFCAVWAYLGHKKLLLGLTLSYHLCYCHNLSHHPMFI